MSDWGASFLQKLQAALPCGREVSGCDGRRRQAAHAWLDWMCFAGNELPCLLGLVPRPRLTLPHSGLHCMHIHQGLHQLLSVSAPAPLPTVARY